MQRARRTEAVQSLYLERRTWLHAWRAGLKLLFVAAMGSGLFLTHRTLILLPAVVMCAGVFLSLGPVSSGVRRLVVSVLIGATLVAGFHAAMGQAALGFASAARLIAMAMLGVSLTLTTRHTELLEVFEWLLAPLARFGVQVNRLSLLLALMMRFTEQFFLQWKRLDDAHRLRTGRAGGWRLLAPLTIQMLVAARRVADTLQLRLGK